MKIRNSFVSNSSSCSYVLSGASISVESLVKFMQDNFAMDFDISHFGYYYAMRFEVDHDDSDEGIVDIFDDYGVKLELKDANHVREIFKELRELDISILVGNGENGVDRGTCLMGFYKGTGEGWVDSPTTIDGDSDGAKSVRKMFEHLCCKVPKDLKPVTHVSARMC